EKATMPGPPGPDRRPTHVRRTWQDLPKRWRKTPWEILLGTGTTSEGNRVLVCQCLLAPATLQNAAPRTGASKQWHTPNVSFQMVTCLGEHPGIEALQCLLLRLVEWQDLGDRADPEHLAH